MSFVSSQTLTDRKGKAILPFRDIPGGEKDSIQVHHSVTFSNIRARWHFSPCSQSSRKKPLLQGVPLPFPQSLLPHLSREPSLATSTVKSPPWTPEHTLAPCPALLFTMKHILLLGYLFNVIPTHISKTPE